MRRSGAIGIPNGDLFVSACLIAVSMAFCTPILFHKALYSLPPLRGALTYGWLTLPAVLAYLLERRTWLPQWLRDCAGSFLLLAALPATVAFVIALRKLFALITPPM
ncbi:hypothetical protein [Armatimonas rosea]|uniref:Uncharacterized protein n=1 Tax=Armatimonas rosea TaxID=685828 RepID=A0A7W9SU70_ARMRO|nr:hypothetical protein [Armatimonas rosea]MBB6052418.1 hypothetical protein [Armatimonas rosea]